MWECLKVPVRAARGEESCAFTQDKAKTVGMDGHAGHCRDVETPATAQLLTSTATRPERGLPTIERPVCLRLPFRKPSASSQEGSGRP